MLDYVNKDHIADAGKMVPPRFMANQLTLFEVE